MPRRMRTLSTSGASFCISGRSGHSRAWRVPIKVSAGIRGGSEFLLKFLQVFAGVASTYKIYLTHVRQPREHVVYAPTELRSQNEALIRNKYTKSPAIS